MRSRNEGGKKSVSQTPLVPFYYITNSLRNLNDSACVTYEGRRYDFYKIRDLLKVTQQVVTCWVKKQIQPLP